MENWTILCVFQSVSSEENHLFHVIHLCSYYQVSSSFFLVLLTKSFFFFKKHDQLKQSSARFILYLKLDRWRIEEEYKIYVSSYDFFEENYLLDVYSSFVGKWLIFTYEIFFNVSFERLRITMLNILISQYYIFIFIF